MHALVHELRDAPAEEARRRLADPELPEVVRREAAALLGKSTVPTASGEERNRSSAQQAQEVAPRNWALIGVTLLTVGVVASLVVSRAVAYRSRTHCSSVVVFDLLAIDQALRQYAIENSGRLPDSLQALVDPDERRRRQDAVKTFVAQKLLFPLVRIYWKVFRPKTYGVKGVLTRAGDSSVLLVRHAYGNTRVWNLPGGGFDPRRESAARAVAREVREELGLTVVAAEGLGEYRTRAQGKRDTVTLFACQVTDEPFSLNDEIAEARYFSARELAELEPLYPITRRALELLGRSALA